MKVIEIKKSLKNSKDCKDWLTENFGKQNWKRLYKFNDPEIRCFEGGFLPSYDKFFVTIAEDGNGNLCAYGGLNIREEIKAIKEIAALYWTIDYGDIWYNPETKCLWISASDGGFWYSEKKLPDSVVEDGGPSEYSFIEFNQHEKTKFIKSVQWEAECGPTNCVANSYIRIGTTSLQYD